MIRKLEELIVAAKSKGKKRLVAAYANDLHTIMAINDAVKQGLIDATLIGSAQTIKNVCNEHGIDFSQFSIMEEESDVKCVSMAIDMINHSEADILMKGLITTDKYMRGILSKENGLMLPKATLSHVTVVELPQYHKLLTITDVAVIPQPDFGQKIQLTNNVISVAKLLGIDMPKVAMIAPSEQILPKVESSTDAAIITMMCERGQIKGAIIDGPLALDVAIDKETADTKKLKSDVAGDADCLVFPNIESANVFFKAATKLCGAHLAAIVTGTKSPCVLTSRGDSEESKLYSIALACLSVK